MMKSKSIGRVCNLKIRQDFKLSFVVRSTEKVLAVVSCLEMAFIKRLNEKTMKDKS